MRFQDDLGIWFPEAVPPHVIADRKESSRERERDGRQMSHFLTVILVCLRTEPRPSEQTPTRRTSHRAVGAAGAARAAWGRTRAAAWTLREARVVAPSGPRSPGGRSTARHWCSSLTTRTPTQWVITPPRLISFYLCCLSQSRQCLSYSSLVAVECVFDCFLSLCLNLFSHCD